MNVDFELYRSFISIYKSGSVSKAALARFMTQPAMSQHLSSLEAMIGEPLFIRQPRKMVPTKKGVELYAKLIASIENLETISWQLGANQTDVIRIGTPAEYFSSVLLKKFSRSPFRLSLKFGELEPLFLQLEEDNIDIMVATKHLSVQGFECVKLYEEQFTLVTSENVSTADVEDIETWLVQQKWISYGLDLPIIRRFWRDHYNKRPPLSPTHVIPDLRIVLSAVENGMGVSILPTYLIQDSLKDHKVFAPFPTMQISNDLFVGYKLANKEKPLIKESLAVLMSVYEARS